MFKETEEESYKLEFKESEKFVSNKLEDKNKWGKCIVALANRYGGELVIGKKDNGEYEGSWIDKKFGNNSKSGFDLLKQKINTFCFEHISPPINCDIDIESNKKGDVVKVTIPRRTSIPHALTYEGKIKRAYYIRTSHGSEPIKNDKLLEWLFKNQSIPSVTHRSHININVQKNRIEPVANIEENGIITLGCIYRGYLSFIEYYRDVIKNSKIELNDLVDFYRTITPYAFLNSLGFIFNNSWLVDIYDGVGQNSISVMEQVEKEKLNYASLTLPTEFNFLSNFNVDIREVLNRKSFKMCYPPNTRISLKWKKNKSIIIMEHKEFKFKFIFSNFFSGEGLGFGSPYAFSISQCKDIENTYQLQNELFKKYNYVQGDFKFEACFDFPENSLGDFEKYFYYANSIKRFIEENWDYKYHIENKPHFYKLYSIEDKINKLLSLAENVNL